MSFLVTGGAGFIGSCIINMLNQRGIDDIVIVDNIGETDKWRNLSNKRYREYIPKSKFVGRAEASGYHFTHVIHMGACSATTEKDFDYLYANNYQFTQELWRYCARHGARFIYAGSAATYGGGEQGFDDRSPIDDLLPLNGYGYSKHLFDLWAQEQEEKPPQHVGLKFFNVYGPNEYYKGTMASVIFHAFGSVMREGKIKLFKSYRDGVAHGEQKRDFLYVKDVCNAVSYFINHSAVSGLFNLGTGRAESFLTLAKSLFAALELPENIEFIDMPEGLKAKYQYYTAAEMSKLRAAGYDAPFFSLSGGIEDYVRNYLAKGYATL